MEVWERHPSTRLSMRERPAATSSTARCRSSIRACSETAKSTRSSFPRPMRPFCASRMRRTWTTKTMARSRAPTAAAAAPIAIQPAAVVNESGIRLPQREDERVFRGVVRGVRLASDRLDVDLQGRACPERGRPAKREDDRLRLIRVDDVDRLLGAVRLRALLDGERDLDLRLLTRSRVLDEHLERQPVGRLD